jgi:hypothetical protein
MTDTVITCDKCGTGHLIPMSGKCTSGMGQERTYRIRYQCQNPKCMTLMTVDRTDADITEAERAVLERLK